MVTSRIRNYHGGLRHHLHEAVRWLLEPKVPSVLTFVFREIAFTIFVFALKTFDLSLACAIWVGSGKCDRGHHRNPALKNPQILSKIVSIHLVAISVTGFWCERSDLLIERPLMPCDSIALLPLPQPGPFWHPGV